MATHLGIHLMTRCIPFSVICFLSQSGMTSKEEKLYYPCSENKGADQLRSYCEADLRLLFSLRQKSGFLTARFI